MSSKSPICEVHIAKWSSPCHQSHQFAKCALPNGQVHVIKVTNLRSAHCQIVKSMSSIHIINATLPSHQAVKCTLSNCQVHDINATSSMPHCQVTFNLQVAHQIVQNYESLRMAPFMNIFFLTFLTSIWISKALSQKQDCPQLRNFGGSLIQKNGSLGWLLRLCFYPHPFFWLHKWTSMKYQIPNFTICLDEWMTFYSFTFVENISWMN
jgi:hypothetical protein